MRSALITEEEEDIICEKTPAYTVFSTNLICVETQQKHGSIKHHLGTKTKQNQIELDIKRYMSYMSIYEV